MGSAPGVRRGRAAALVTALVAFLALGLLMRARVFAFAEEMMLHTTARTAAVARTQPEHGPLAWEPSCADAPPPATLLSPHRRPTFSVCAGGRRYPLIVASYMAGYFYWPVALFSPLHHDNILSLRHLSLLLGLVDIGLTFLVVRRLRGDDLASDAAVAIAVSPCFLVTHATLVHFETLPWTFLMAAVLLLLDCRALAPRAPSAAPPDDAVPTKRLLLAAFCVGLSLAANLKAIFLIGPVFLVALRLGLRLSPIKPRQWAAAVVAGLLPMGPSLWFALSHPGMFLAGDKSGDMGSALRDNLVHPERLLHTIGDMLSFWSNFGRYMDPRGSAPLDVVAYAAALGAFVFVVVDAARTLRRGRGCAVTAATAAVVLAHVVMLALLVKSYPVNFTPLHVAFGLCVAVAGHRLWSWGALARLGAHRQLVVRLVLAGAFAASSVQTARILYELPAPFNLHAEKQLITHLTAVVPGDGEIHTVSTENLMTDVIESLSEGHVAVAQAQDYLVQCRRGERRSGGAGDVTKACFSARFRRLLEGLPDRGALRFVLPADLGVLRDRTREGAAGGMRDGLVEAARELGRTAVAEATFHTASGVPAIVVYRVEP